MRGVILAGGSGARQALGRVGQMKEAQAPRGVRGLRARSTSAQLSRTALRISILPRAIVCRAAGDSWFRSVFLAFTRSLGL